MGTLAVGGNRTFALLDLRTEDVMTGTEDRQDRRLHLGLDRAVLGLKIKEGDVHRAGRGKSGRKGRHERLFKNAGVEILDFGFWI